MPSQYVSVKDISPMHRNRSIRVRLVRTYQIPELRGGQTSKSMELFRDIEGTYIHANILKNDVAKYIDIFSEGKLYSIKNFLVVTNYLTYKTTEHPFLIKFNYKTEVKQIKSKGFPMLMFRLKSFQSLKDPAQVNEKELFDVIDIVVEIYAPLDKTIAGKSSRLMDFLIADTEQNTLKCIVLDGHVATMIPFYNVADLKEPLIVVLQLCRAKIVNAAAIETPKTSREPCPDRILDDVGGAFDCSMVYICQKEDPWNSIIVEAATGGVLSLRQGLGASADLR
nr:replication protein A 70 kDa DNA-binding subunit D-like [Ipomoea batatas]